jgi:predicted amidohydrolase
MMKQVVKIGLIQTACSNDLKSNISKTSALIDEAGSQGAKIVCLQYTVSLTVNR